MNCYEKNDINAKVEDWMIDVIDKCSYSSINRERRAILEILAGSDNPITASQIGSSRGLGFDKQSVEIYLNPLFAVGLVKKQVNSNTFKWFIEEGSTRDFINKVACTVPQIKLKEYEDPILDEEEELNAEAKALWNSVSE